MLEQTVKTFKIFKWLTADARDPSELLTLLLTSIWMVQDHQLSVGFSDLISICRWTGKQRYIINYECNNLCSEVYLMHILKPELTKERSMRIKQLEVNKTKLTSTALSVVCAVGKREHVPDA